MLRFSCVRQAFQYSYLAYRWEERRGADSAFADAAEDEGDPNALKVLILMS